MQPAGLCDVSRDVSSSPLVSGSRSDPASRRDKAPARAGQRDPVCAKARQLTRSGVAPCKVGKQVWTIMALTAEIVAFGVAQEGSARGGAAGFEGWGRVCRRCGRLSHPSDSCPLS